MVTAAIPVSVWVARYDRVLRGRMAEALCELGIQADAAGAWAEVTPGTASRNLRPHFKKIRGDAALALVGAIAALVREHERGDTK